jgi:hypothetical protein
LEDDTLADFISRAQVPLSKRILRASSATRDQMQLPERKTGYK